MPKSVFTDEYDLLLATLIAVRKEKGVSQVELAKRLGRPQPFVSYLERGERRLDVIEFYAVMKALGADPIAVFTELIEKFPDSMVI